MQDLRVGEPTSKLVNVALLALPECMLIAAIGALGAECTTPLLRVEKPVALRLAL